jgi:hypothetical protein
MNLREKLRETFDEQKEKARGKKDGKKGKPADVQKENTFYLEGWVDGVFERLSNV